LPADAVTVAVLVIVGAARVTPVPPVIALPLLIAPPAPLSVNVTVAAAVSGPHVDIVPLAALSVAEIVLLELKLPTLKLPVVMATEIAPDCVDGFGSQTQPAILAAVTVPVDVPTFRLTLPAPPLADITCEPVTLTVPEELSAVPLKSTLPAVEVKLPAPDTVRALPGPVPCTTRSLVVEVMEPLLVKFGVLTVAPVPAAIVPALVTLPTPVMVVVVPDVSV
jgi:hypothetical protein